MKKVLIIEDSAELASHWQAAFEVHDLHVIHEPAYEKAIDVLRETTVDLVITDIVLPNANGELLDFAGMAILSFIGLQLTSPPKVIAVSGSRFEETARPIKHLLDCAKFLQKPFAVETIVDLGIKLLGEKSLEERLGRSVEVEHATDSVFWVNQRGEFLYVSQAAVRAYQYSHEELMGMTVNQIDSEISSTEQFRDFTWPAVKQNGHRTITTNHRRKDGSIFPVEIAAYHVDFEGDEFACAFVRDITQRRADEEELRLFGAAIKAAQDAFLIAKVGSDRKEISVVFANDAYTRTTGYAIEETIGRRPRLLSGSETSQHALVAIADALSSQKPASIEILLYDKDGKSFWCHFQLTPIADARGSVTHWLMILEDVTQQKIEREALVEVKTQRAVVELLGRTGGVWDWNLQTNQVTFQPGYRQLLGYHGPNAGWLPDDFESLASEIHPDDRDRVLAGRTKSLETQSSYDEEYRLRSKDGAYIWVHDRGAAVYAEDGRPTRMTGSIYDITEQRKAQLALVKEREMLQLSNSDLEQFAYVASHDLQEPLRAVGGFMQILAQQYSDKLDEKGIGYIEKAVAGAERMQQLINDLLHFAKVTREATTMKSVNLNDAVREACVTLQSVIDRRSAKVDVGELPAIQGEANQLAQLFQNLIDNAIKYCQADVPCVTIRSSEELEHWIVSVSDNGIGIDLDYREQIFSIFKRLHHREEYPGTGIGLAICHRVVQRHGGSITIEDQEGVADGQPGSRLVLKFPKPKSH